MDKSRRSNAIKNNPNYNRESPNSRPAQNSGAAKKALDNSMGSSNKPLNNAKFVYGVGQNVANQLAGRFGGVSKSISYNNSGSSNIPGFMNKQQPVIETVINTYQDKAPTLHNLVNEYPAAATSLQSPIINYKDADFIYTKFYGIIPNNYMITVTRFNLPVNDEGQYSTSGAVIEDKQIDKARTGTFVAREVAHAVTYFGKKTSNTLSSLLNMGGGMLWESESSKDTKISSSNSIGGSIKIDLNAFNNQIKQKESAKGLSGILNKSNVMGFIQSFGSATASTALGGMTTYKILKAFAKRYISPGQESSDPEIGDISPRDQLTINQQSFDPYEQNGIFARKSFGGINKITQTQKRKQGISFDHNLSIKFNYSLKNLAYSSFGQGPLNSKIAMLDIIGNLMALVMSNSEFYGGSNRYKPSGYQFEFSTDIKELMLTATAEDIIKELKNRVEVAVKETGNEISALVNLLKDVLSGNEPQKSQSMTDSSQDLFRLIFYEFFKNNGGSNTSGAKDDTFNLINMQPGQAPALLTGQNVGEWHVLVGNPFNPIAKIGNLVCTGYELKFPNDELGPNDFPTEVEFTIKLSPGRPRDRRAVTNMFGFIHKSRTGSTDTEIERTSSTRDSDIDDAPSKINLQEALRRAYFRPGEKIGPRRNIVGSNALIQNLMDGGSIGRQDWLSPGASFQTQMAGGDLAGAARRLANISALMNVVEQSPKNMVSYVIDNAQLDVAFKAKEINEGYANEAGQEVGRFPYALTRIRGEKALGGITTLTVANKIPPFMLNNL